MIAGTVEKLRAAIDRRVDAMAMGTPDVMEQSARSLNAALEAVEREVADLRRPCPDCGSPMPGEMCAVCALAHAEAELIELRKRPALEEVLRSIAAASCVANMIPDEGTFVLHNSLEAVRALFAEKAVRIARAGGEQEVGSHS